MKGIVRQGVRCKDCGISCHKHCKEHVVVDCSKRKEKKCKCQHTRVALPIAVLLMCRGMCLPTHCCVINVLIKGACACLPIAV